MFQPVQLAALVVVVVVLTVQFAEAKSQHVHTLTDSNFDHLTSTGQWLVDVWAPW